MADQTGWVIERYSGDELFYWDGRGLGDYHKPRGFSSKNEEAIRFARKEDAEAILFRLLEGHGRAVEHVWMEPAP